MAVAAGATLFLALGGGLAAWTSRQHQAEKKALEREIARQSEEAQAAQLAFDGEDTRPRREGSPLSGRSEDHEGPGADPRRTPA